MTSLRVLLSLLLSLGSAPFSSAQQAASAAGHWEGTLTLPATALAIRIDLEQAGGVWTGTIDIPVQGLRGAALAEVMVDGAALSFALPGVPGDPRFTGALSDDATTITGQLAQSGQTFPFTIERTEKPVGATGETPSRGVPGNGLAGYWQGSLRPSPVAELRLVLEVIAGTDGSFAGTLTSVDQGQARFPVTALTESTSAVHFEASNINAAFDGALSEDGSEIAGQWHQGPGALPLVFRRLAAAPTFVRAQDPTPPFPYVAEEVTVQNEPAGITLAGTFTIPNRSGPHPAVVLISGSGPQDRDESLMGHRPFLVLADHLTRQGIAVLRYDDRGVGQSAGSFGTATHDDFTTDALAAVDWLRIRADVDPERIGLVGHSEGGLVAPLAAVQQPGNIAFIVLLAGVGVPMDELLVQQGQDLARVMGAGPEMLARNAASQRAMFDLLQSDLDQEMLEGRLREMFQAQLSGLTDEQREAGGFDSIYEGQIQSMLRPWFRQIIRYDPAPTLRQVKVPVLAINGERDLQVAADENLTAIGAALAAGGNTKVTTRSFPGLNHLFQTAATGAMTEYGEIEETFNPAALTAVSDWIRLQTGLE